MKTFTVEWVFVQDMFQQNPCIDRECDPRITIPVVRLAEVDALIQEAVTVMTACQAVGEIRFKTCVLSAQVSDQIQAVLDSPLVKAWRERQEQNGKKEQGYSRAEFENDQMGQTGTDLSRKEPS